MKKNNLAPKEGLNEILLYTTRNGKVKVEIYLQNETIWLTQQKIADLFGVERSVVTKHLSNIYNENELNKEATCAKIAQVQTESLRSVSRQIEFYNLDAIISVGYRVNSTQATHFRIRDIRSSERRFYQKITDICSQCSADSISAIKSSTFSIPTERRNIVSRMPAFFRSSSVNSA